MSLERIELKNFQCHRSLAVEFDPLVTTLTGKTNAGKSAILRALRWLAQNFPAGNEFISDGEKYSRVRLIVDGRRITRRIGDRNEYRLDGKVYKAFGRAVPSAIVELLNVTDENFQGQLDAPFWFSLSPGQVAKELNRIVDLGVIDQTLTNLAQVGRQAASEVALTKTRLQEAKEAKARLAWAPALGERLVALQAQGERLAAKAASRAILAEICREAAQLGLAKRNAYKRKLGALKTYRAGEVWFAKQQAVEGLRGLVTETKRLEQQQCDQRKKLERATKELRQATQGKRCPICDNVFSLSSAPTST